MKFIYKTVIVLNLLFSFSYLTIFSTSISNAEINSEEQGNDDENDLDLIVFKELLSKINKTTKIATKTKLNSDYVPGIVTVLEGKELLRKGCHTVIDAIETVPGFMKTGSNLIIRGIGEVIYSGKLKLLLNNVPMNDSLAADCNPIYLIPIEQVERIELIRGPGSTLYGKFAYAGVVNVITRKDENRLFIGYGNNNTRFNGLNLFYKSKNKNSGINLNFSDRQNDRTGRIAGPDSLYNTPNERVSLAPGEIDDSSKFTLASLQMYYEDFYFLGQYISKTYGSSFGMLGALPPLDENRLDVDSYYMFQTNWKPELSKDISLNLYVGIKQSCYNEDDTYFYPPGFAMPTGISYTDGVIGGPHYEERDIYSGLELNYNINDSSSIQMGLEYENIKTLDVWASRNYELLEDTYGIPGIPLPEVRKFTGDGNWLKENISRNILGIYIQNQLKLTDRLALTTGLRYDNYDDIGDKFSPRISAVYNLFDKNIFKFQYAEAFRPPSFMEMYSINNPLALGSKDILPEKIKTYELGYIFIVKKTSIKYTLYHSELKDLIIFKDHYYKNKAIVNSRGAELEVKWNINEKLSIDSSFSFTKTYDKISKKDIGGSAKTIGNIGIMCRPFNNFYLNLQNHYVGDRKRSSGDSRPDLDSYFCTNLSVISENVFKYGLNIRLSIKNLFETDIRYPSSDYAEDYPAIGREGLIIISKDF